MKQNVTIVGDGERVSVNSKLHKSHVNTPCIGQKNGLLLLYFGP